MVLSKELRSRIRDFFSFSKQEISGLIVAVLITGFVFSFRDWGIETLDLAIGLRNLFIASFVAAISFFLRISMQKIYALAKGYKTEFKIWWTGLIISLIVAFVSAGRLPLVLIGASVSSFMIKQRLGEFRYGFSHSENATIALWSVLGSLITATLFAAGLHFAPGSYLFNKGLLLNLIMALCALVPLPQLEGLQIYFGSRIKYFVGIFAVLLTSLLLMTKTTVGLITTIVVGATMAIIFILKSGD